MGHSNSHSLEHASRFPHHEVELFEPVYACKALYISKYSDTERDNRSRNIKERIGLTINALGLAIYTIREECKLTPAR